MPEGTLTKAGIAARNDLIRSRLPFSHPADRFVMTCGIDALEDAEKFEALTAVKSFDAFTEDNDPHGEHDFISVTLKSGTKCFWKVDDYNGHDGIRCVVTLLLADEY